MVRELSFAVYGSPIAQPRQRHTALMRDGKAIVGPGGRPVVLNYTPKTAPATQWKSDVRKEANVAISQNGGFVLQRGPLRIDIDFYFHRPQKYMGKKYPEGALYHVSRPDRDNCDKGILDALKGIIFADDCQVCQGEIRKFYAEKNGRPRAEIRIYVLEG